MAQYWKRWPEVREITSGKRIVLFGCSRDWIPKTLARISKTPEYIVDKDRELHGTRFGTIEVRSPEALRNENLDEVYVIITSGSYVSIVSILESYGLRSGINFCCTPEYLDLKLLDTVRHYDQKVVVTSPDHHSPDHKRGSRAGGGIFVLSTEDGSLETKQAGAYRQIIQSGDYFFSIEHAAQFVAVLDKTFSIIEKFPLDRGGYCGIELDEKRNIFVVINSSTDTISLHQKEDFRLLERVHYSQSNNTVNEGLHHLNDVLIKEDHVIVSYFSHGGLWQQGIYDGGLSKFDVENLGSGPTRLCSGFWKPHSPKLIHGEICFLDSMRGSLLFGDQTIGGTFPGFVRGLTHDDRFYYVGLSESMYISRLKHVRSDIMLNAGVFLFDRESRTNRFFPMNHHMNIHDLLIVQTS